MLNKREFIAKFAEVSGRSKAESSKIVESMIQTFEKAVLEDGGVQITGVITLGTKTVASKNIINPSTKKPMQTKESKSLYVKTGKTLKDKMNG